MEFETAPDATGIDSITMTAATATDPSGVEYFFDATDGGNDSGWQDSPDYTDTGLTPETTYSYRVRARDKSEAQNTTGWSAAAATTTGSVSSVAVTNSKTVEGARTGNGDDVSITEPAWSLTGGNAVAVYFTAENGQTFTASFGGQEMTVVEMFDGDRFVVGVAYLINPNVTEGDVIIDAVNSGSSRLSHAYSILSLSGVGSVAATDTRTSNGDLTYTTATDGGYVLGAAINNSFNGSTLPTVSGNPSVTMLQTNVDGNASMLHAHGAVADVGSYTDSYSGGIETAATVAFNSSGGSGGDSSFTLWTDNFPGLSDTTPSLDYDGGGLATALEWVLGGDPTHAGDDAGLVPTADATSDPDGKLLITFRRSADAHADEDTIIAVEYGSDLSGTWTAATHQGTGPDDITITETPDGFGQGIDQVTVALPASLTAEDKLFARLSVAIATP